MSRTPSSIAGKSLWTIGTFGASAGIRFATNIVLSYLLGPEILGVVVIAQAVRTGTELLTDMGMEQNVVHSVHGNDARFLDTVWTLQIARGGLIALACAVAAYAIAPFYRIEIALLLAISAAPFLNALASTSLYTLSKNLDVKARTLFELAAELIGFVVSVALALAWRDVWAPILGILLSLAARSALSYALPHPRPRFRLDRDFCREILLFSRWIMLSSLLFFAAIYADRLYLGRVVGLTTLGIYGLARAISDLPQAVAGRLAFQIVLPFVAKHHRADDAAPRVELARTRRHFLLLVAVGIATAMAWSDWAVELLYDRRYREAGWMLFLLLCAGWPNVLAYLNEGISFGYGRPRDVSLANLVRVTVMAVALPTGFFLLGLPGAILALPASELARYAALATAQRRLAMTFVVEDAVVTLGLVALLGAWVAIRIAAGFGVPWALMP